MSYSACILQDTKIFLYNQTTKESKTLSLSTEEAPITLSHVINKSELLISTKKKDLFLYKINEDLTLNLQGQIILPKRLTHSFVYKNRFYYWDKFGDINSLDIDDIRGKGPEDNMNPGLVKEDGNSNPRPNKDLIVHESGNFCTLTSFCPFKFENGDIGLGIADEYYKIRIFDFPNLHSLKTSISFRKRYVVSMTYFKGALYLIFDDMKLFRVNQEEIMNSFNDLENISEVKGFDFEAGSNVIFMQNSDDKLNFFVDNQEIVRFGVEEKKVGEDEVEFELVERESVVKSGDESRLVLAEYGGDWTEFEHELAGFEVFEMKNVEYELVAKHEI